MSSRSAAATAVKRRTKEKQEAEKQRKEGGGRLGFMNKLYMFFAVFVAMLSYLVLTAPDDGWVLAFPHRCEYCRIVVEQAVHNAAQRQTGVLVPDPAVDLANVNLRVGTNATAIASDLCDDVLDRVSHPAFRFCEALLLHRNTGAELELLLPKLKGTGSEVASAATFELCGAHAAMCAESAFPAPPQKRQSKCDVCALLTREVSGVLSRELLDPRVNDTAFVRSVVDGACAGIGQRHSRGHSLKTEAETKRDAFYRETCDELVQAAGDGFVDAVSAEPWLARLDWTCVGVAQVCSRDWFFNDAHPEMQQAGG